MKKTDNIFTILSSEILFSEKVNDSEKILYSFIVFYSKKTGYTTKSNADFASIRSKSERTILRELSRLKEADFITINHAYNPKSNTVKRSIYPNGEGVTDLSGGGDRSGECTYSNIYNINKAQGRKFYQNQIDKHINEKSIEKYKSLVEFIYEKNPFGRPLNAVLKLDNQLTFQQMKKILEMKKNISVFDTLEEMENNPLKIKGKVSLNLTLQTWIKNRQKWNNQ